MSLKNISLFALAIVLHFGALAQDLRKDKAIGNEGLTQVIEQIGIYPFASLDTVIQQLGQRLVGKLDEPLFDYEFYLVDMPEPNAFALPGGKVFVTRGLLLLPLTEDELAGVIGHEIIHANNRHGIKQQRNSVLGAIIAIPGILLGSILPGEVGQAVASPFLLTNALITSSYSRGHEHEADEEGIALAAKAGYQPIELAAILDRLNSETEFLTGEEEEQSYFSSHPYTPKRIKSIQKEAQKLTVANEAHIVKNDDFLRLFNNLLISENPANGFTTDEGIFYQPTQLYSIALSDAWETQTSLQTLSIKDTANQVMAMINVKEDTLSFEGFLTSFRKMMRQQSGLEPIKKEKFTWFGHNGGMLEYEQKSGDKKIRLQLFAVSYINGQLLKMMAIYDVVSEKEAAALFKSVQTVSKKDIPAAEVSRLFVVEALENETLEQLMARNDTKEFSRLIAVINGLNLYDKLKKGDLVKIVKRDSVRF